MPWLSWFSVGCHASHKIFKSTHETSLFYFSTRMLKSTCDIDDPKKREEQIATHAQSDISNKNSL